jgi:ABC-type Fe3+-hydroxamate transport system substrate-binding protein
MEQRTVIDQMCRKVVVPTTPLRIISLVPSQTEWLYDLGLDDRVVGITKFCIHPAEWHKIKTRVGGTKNYHFDRIAALNPDLIIGNKEENDRDQIEQLAQLYPVWMSDIKTIADAIGMMASIADLTQTQIKSKFVINQIKAAFAIKNDQFLGKTVLYVIWRNPFMAVGTDTFVNEMLAQIGLTNAVVKTRYPTLTNQDIAALNPDYVFLSSEPYPFDQTHIAELQAILPDSKIILVDGEMFSWYGPRMLEASGYIKALGGSQL